MRSAWSPPTPGTSPERLPAGCVAAFVGRPGKVLSPVGDQPDISGEDLLEVAERIIEAEGRRA